MTVWLSLYPPFKVPRGPDGVLRRGWKQVDPDLYGRLIGVSNDVQDRATRCYAGSAWLRRRYHARSRVEVRLLPADDASVSVEHLKTKGFGAGADGPKQLRCGLHLPTSWLAQPGDGLLGLRLFQAVLQALHAVGEHHGIGTPAAVGPASDRGDPEVWDPFRPRSDRPSYADINALLDRLAATLRPEQLLLAVKGPTSSTVGERCRNVREALGAVVEKRTLTAPGVKATAWIIQAPS